MIPSSILIFAVENDANKCAETFCYTIKTIIIVLSKSPYESLGCMDKKGSGSSIVCETSLFIIMVFVLLLNEYAKSE